MAGKGVTMLNKGNKSKTGVTKIKGEAKPKYTKVYGDGAASGVQDKIMKRHEKLKKI